MKTLKDDRERLINAWLKATTSISQLHRFEDLRYNEAVICNLLMKNKIENPGTMLTATDLCRQSHIMKSQMNRTLQSMEEKGLVRRHRSTEDRRRVFMELREDSDLYERQHRQVLRTVDALLERLDGVDQESVLAVLEAIGDAAISLGAHDEELARAEAADKDDSMMAAAQAVAAAFSSEEEDQGYAESMAAAS